jgi:hypothetical protein
MARIFDRCQQVKFPIQVLALVLAGAYSSFADSITSVSSISTQQIRRSRFPAAVLARTALTQAIRAISLSVI